MITVTEVTRALQKLRRQQSTPEFRTLYRLRVIVEHRLARLCQLGIRQARYFGRAKTAFQLAIAAAVANLTLAIAHSDWPLIVLLVHLSVLIVVLALSVPRTELAGHTPQSPSSCSRTL